MIVGIHNFVDAIGQYKEDVANGEGGLWIVMMDGLLLIPLAMAAFFYPVQALVAAVIAVALSLTVEYGMRTYLKRHPDVRDEQHY